jgi:diguanylate cyclase (GGDEF)-like protein/PAS domain S-box-containing protein
VTYLIATLAVLVAVEYTVIAFDMVPRLARLAEAPTRTVNAARWGAAAFFLGCAYTHVAIALVVLLTPHGDADMAADTGWTRLLLVVQHVLPHLAQVIGGAVFIVVGKTHLEVNLTSKARGQELRERERRFRAAFDRAPTGVVLIDMAHVPGLVLEANPTFCTLVGRDEAELSDLTFRQLVHPADGSLHERARTSLLDGTATEVDIEERLVHRDGHEVWTAVQASVVPDDDGRLRYCVAQVRDIRGEREQQSRLVHLAEHDSLTEVFNRRRFEDELDRVLASVRRHQHEAALLVVDLDQFKYVNDTYGHRAGDELLRRIATVLKDRLRSTDYVGRLGGDEFGVLCPHTGTQAATTLAHSLLAAIRTQGHICVADRAVRTSASIGIRPMRGDEALTGEQILAEADVAMYESKETGRDRVSVYSAPNAAGAGMRSHLAWSERIRDALVGGGLRLFEQPILNLDTGVADRCELLVRMVDPEDGSVVRPGRFLETAERFGQVQAIDRWVFGQALTLLRTRQEAGDRRVLEVNLSGASVGDSDLVAELTDMIVSAAVDTSGLIVEVTETTAVGNMEQARHAASQLSELGCRFSLDDFGSGFGSFYYLKHLPFHAVKIDGDFVKDLPASHEDRLTLEAIATIAHGLGKETTAEFVQNEETIELLRQLGIGYAQGYYIGRPKPVPELASGLSPSRTALA